MILVGQRVELLTREGTVLGVVGKKPIHLLRDEERKKVPGDPAICTSTSARPDGDAAKAAVRIGDVAVIAGEPVEGVMGDRVISRAMDNRLGSYIALEAARLVAEGGSAPGRRRGAGRRAGGDHLRRCTHLRLRAARPTSRSPWTSRTRRMRPASTSSRRASTSSARGR